MTFLGGLGGLSLGGTDLERLEYVFTGGKLDPHSLDDLTYVVVGLSELERQTANPLALLGAVEGQLKTVVDLCCGSSTPELRSLAGELLGLLGWLRWDRGEYDAARKWFALGVRAANEGNDKALAAYLTGSHAVLPFSSEDPNQRLRLLDGVRFEDATPHTQAWLMTLRAGAYAMVGDTHGFEVATLESENLLSRPDDPRTRRPRAPFFSPVYLYEERSAAEHRLGLAARAVETAMTVRDDAYGDLGLWLDTDIAYATEALGEPERAAELALVAWRGAKLANVEPVQESLRKLANVLEPARYSPVVQEFVTTARSA